MHSPANNSHMHKIWHNFEKFSFVKSPESKEYTDESQEVDQTPGGRSNPIIRQR